MCVYICEFMCTQSLTCIQNLNGFFFLFFFLEKTTNKFDFMDRTTETSCMISFCVQFKQNKTKKKTARQQQICHKKQKKIKKKDKLN